jgi:MazG family protein
MTQNKTLEDLTALVHTLRGPSGCPWDREQNTSDMKSYLTGELYELLDAIDQGNALKVKEEAGDLLFLIIFLVDIYRERGEFDINEVMTAIRDKMIRRHPHVFGNTQVKGSQEVKTNWRQIKREEGKPVSDDSLLDVIPDYLPALVQAQSLTSKASRVGFDWSHPQQIISKIEEETGELKTCITDNEKHALEHELGDLLFSVVNLARFMDIDAEKALRKTNHKFICRFQYIEHSLRNAGKSIEHTSLEEMDRLWEEAKKQES